VTTTLAAELISVSKVYDGCVANDSVNLKIQSGTVHGLVGENGAGKSTAMKILYGAIQPSGGQILINGRTVSHWNPRLAAQNGLGMVYQHFMLAPSETVLDNIVLGVEIKGPLGIRKRKQEIDKLNELMEQSGLKVPLHQPISALNVAEKSRCEILKVLYRNASLLILDEPTSVLSPQEIDRFLKTLLHLKSQGKTILMVTHKLGEILAIADHLTVMRSGRTIAELDAKDTNEEDLATLMVGRKLNLPKNTDIRTKNEKSNTVDELAVAPFGITVHTGEIVGIAGIEGNGQDQIIEHITKDAEALRTKPIGVIPPDRHKEGLVLEMNLQENLYLGRYQKSKKSYKTLASGTASVDADLFLKSHDVRPANHGIAAKDLSGGNQQKLIVSREMDFIKPQPKGLLAVHPTRGVDLGAIEQIHQKLLQAKARGCGILLISSDLQEILALSDRIAVVFGGNTVAWFTPPYDVSQIGLCMLAGKPHV
jgi:simple sugar transport system ATP-binding protein